MKILLVLFIMVLTVFVLWIGFPKISPENATDAIVGEASNQDFDTMVCVAQAIRHRGTLKGVYGFRAQHNLFENETTWDLAEDAWEQSWWRKDQVKGAKNWGTDKDLIKLKVLSYKIKCGDLYFY